MPIKFRLSGALKSVQPEKAAQLSDRNILSEAIYISRHSPVSPLFQK
ncbi:hypothetical protein [Sphingobium yanoikuyae]|nr:hypothetical protein [Sphingobium yanoikuyae]